jgi:hypothetical protein
MGTYLFTVREISTRKIVNAKIEVMDAGRFLAGAQEGRVNLISWISQIILNPTAVFPDVSSPTEGVARFLALMLAMGQLDAL